MSTSDLLEPSRIETLCRIMSRYGAHLRVDDKIRVGIEGDPCNVFRSVDDAPCATVIDVERRDDGFVKFKARFDESREVVEFNNRSFDPRQVWEIHPDHLETFSVHASESQGSYRGEDSTHNSRHSTHETDARVEELSARLSSFTKDMSERIAALEDSQNNFRGSEDVKEQLNDLRETDTAFRETIASTIRALAGDTLRLAKGEPVEFAHQYADRYDIALEDKASSEYRGASPRHSASQKQKWDFDAYRNGDATVAKEASELTDIE